MKEGPKQVRIGTGGSLNWGLYGGKRIRPYVLTEGAVDVMEVSVREKIDVHGVGTDVVHMHGVFVVKRDHPRAAKGAREVDWRNAEIATEFRLLELYGESDVFGTVRVRLNNEQISSGLVGPTDAKSMAKACKANFHPVIEMPELGIEMNTGKEAVPLSSKVISIPPVGDVARSEQPVKLVNATGEVVGELISADVEVGRVLWEHPLGATERRAE
jgi:hypothetical protein